MSKPYPIHDGVPAPSATHGGPDRGQGRKPLSEDDPTVVVSVRMPYTMREKLMLLGGSHWVRRKIEQEPEPKP